MRTKEFEHCPLSNMVILAQLDISDIFLRNQGQALFGNLLVLISMKHHAIRIFSSLRHSISS